MKFDGTEKFSRRLIKKKEEKCKPKEKDRTVKKEEEGEGGKK